jgi:hypothetical protein
VSRAAPLTTQTVFEDSIRKPITSANKAAIAQNVPTVVRTQLTDAELQNHAIFNCIEMRISPSCKIG